VSGDAAGPLRGRTILVTRDEPEGGPLSSALEALGATVVRVPVLETLPPEDPDELAREAQRLADYDWVLFTSARAVGAVAREAPANGRAPRVAAVGEGTARAVRDAGWEPEVVGTGGGEALVAELRARAELEGRLVLFPAADRARRETVRRLEEAGASVRVVTAYRTVARAGAAAALAAALARGNLDAAVFTSPSAVEALEDAGGLALRFAAAGDATREALEAAGARRVVTVERPGFDDLARALARALGPG